MTLRNITKQFLKKILKTKYSFFRLELSRYIRPIHRLKKKIKEKLLKLRFVLNQNSVNEKKILGIWDLSNHGTSIGYIIDLQIRLLCESEINKINKIDFVFIYDDSENIDISVKKTLNKNNVFYHLMEMLPILNTNPRLNSIFYFKSKKQFENFYKENRRSYIATPSIGEYLNKSFFYKETIYRLNRFYSKNKKLPLPLEFKPLIVDWVFWFFKKVAQNKIVITVNLRQNKIYSAGHRNSNLKAWNVFFDFCAKKYPELIFIVLGRKNESTNFLKNKHNLVFAKEYNTTIEQDLALINYSFFHMGTTSGPATFPIETEHIPYIITNHANNSTNLFFNKAWWKQGENVPWSNKETQRLIWAFKEKETPELLIREFEDLFNKLDKQKWLEKTSAHKGLGNIEWPFT